MTEIKISIYLIYFKLKYNFNANLIMFCVIGDDKSISIWDLSTNSLMTELKAHQDSVINLDWSPDGQFIASSSIDGVVCLWSTQEHINVNNR